MPYIRMRFDKRLPLEAFHRRAMDYFRQYLIVGGMPQAVAKYVETRDFEKVDEVKRDILALYRSDIHKYADNQETKVAAIFEEIPGQLRKREKKFVLSALQSEARMRDYSQAFFWLNDAKIINCCYNSTEPSIGLKLSEERTTLKCYMGDTGLLISHAFDERGIISADLYRKLMFDKLEVNEGMLVENIVAQMFRAAGHKLYFFSNSSRTSADDRMAIDFLIAKPVTTSRHNISPIEVKSGQRYTLNSLRKCIAKYGSQLSTPYLLHDKDVKTEDGIVYLPACIEWHRLLCSYHCRFRIGKGEKSEERKTEKIEKDGPDGPECQISADDLIGKWNVIGDRWDLENGTSACYLMDDNSPDGYAHDEDGNLITITVKEYCQQYAEDYNADPANEVKGTAEDFADKLYSYYGLSGLFEVTEERISFTWGLDVGFSALYVDGDYAYDSENCCMTVKDEAIPSDPRDLRIDVFTDSEGRMCFRYPEYYISTMYSYDETEAWWIYAPVIFYCEKAE